MKIGIAKKLGFSLLMILAIGCGDATDTPGDQPLDPENGSFGIDGKADSLNGLSENEVENILAIANSYTLDELDAFLNVRAARNIISRRESRGVFETLEQLDRVSYVGRSALEAFREEAQSFEGIPEVTDPSEMVEIREIDGRYSSEYQIVFHGQLSQDLRAQPGVENALTCNEATGSCTFRYRFDDLNDYTDRAESGHIAVSFRSDEAASRADSFRGLAANLSRFSDGGPLECQQVETQSRCIALYGPCHTQYRCGVRLPNEKPELDREPAEPSEAIVASELVQIAEVDGPYSSTEHEISFYGKLAEALHAQPGVENSLTCNDDISACSFRYRFESVNDYIDRAEAGHIAVSFRSDETRSDGFRRLAGNISRYSDQGPLECQSVETRCIALYGPCNTQYRCGVRLPE